MALHGITNSTYGARNDEIYVVKEYAGAHESPARVYEDLESNIVIIG